MSSGQIQAKTAELSLIKLPQQTKNTNARLFLYYLKWDRILIMYVSRKDIKQQNNVLCLSLYELC